MSQADASRALAPPPVWRAAMPVLWRLARQLVGAAGLIIACGFGYWWLEPNTPTLADGLWLAFVTAATVGYGDVVPSTMASKAFSIVVVLIGFGVLSLVTAAIAAIWVGAQERQVEREILTDLHQQLRELRLEIAALRQARSADGTASGDATAPVDATAVPAGPRTAACRRSGTAGR